MNNKEGSDQVIGALLPDGIGTAAGIYAGVALTMTGTARRR